MEEKIVEKEDKIEASEVVENETKKEDKDFVIPLPEEEKPKPSNLPPNSKPYWTIRIAGGFIDVCLLFLATIGLNQLFMLSPMGKTIDTYSVQMAEIIDNYRLKPLVEGSTETYGHKLYESEEDYSKYTTSGYLVHKEEGEGNYYVVVQNAEISDTLKKAYNSAIKADADYSRIQFNWSLVSFGMTALSAFIAEGVFFLAVPFITKRRASVGKLAAGAQVIDSKYQKVPKWYQTVGRFLFIYIVETMLPYLLITNMLLMLAIVPPILFIITLFNKKGRTLHDFVTRTMVIDKRTFLPLDKQ